MDGERAKGSIGYSDRISDPVFTPPEAPAAGQQGLKYMLFVVPLVVLVLLWRSAVLATWLFIVLLAAVIVLALFPILKGRRAAEDKTWDGTIVSVERREPVMGADVRKVDPATRDKMILTTIKIQDEEGTVHTYERMGGLPEDYREYYHEGDRVRHHKGFVLPEKYDKSADDTVVCIVCGRINSMDSRRCTECGAVLLK